MAGRTAYPRRRKAGGRARGAHIAILVIVVFIAISVFIAIVQHNSSITFIAQMMGISWGALAGAFLAPFLYGLYWKRANKYAVWTCFGFSVAVMLLNVFFGGYFPAVLRSRGGLENPLVQKACRMQISYMLQDAVGAGQ